MTYPIWPFESTFNSLSNVAFTLLSEYKPIGELNCLWTSFRCCKDAILLNLRFFYICLLFLFESFKNNIYNKLLYNMLLWVFVKENLNSWQELYCRCLWCVVYYIVVNVNYFLILLGVVVCGFRCRGRFLWKICKRRRKLS